MIKNSIPDKIVKIALTLVFTLIYSYFLFSEGYDISVTEFTNYGVFEWIVINLLIASFYSYLAIVLKRELE